MNYKNKLFLCIDFMSISISIKNAKAALSAQLAAIKGKQPFKNKNDLYPNLFSFKLNFLKYGQVAPETCFIGLFLVKKN